MKLKTVDAIDLRGNLDSAEVQVTQGIRLYIDIAEQCLSGKGHTVEATVIRPLGFRVFQAAIETAKGVEEFS